MMALVNCMRLGGNQRRWCAPGVAQLQVVVAVVWLTALSTTIQPGVALKVPDQDRDGVLDRFVYLAHCPSLVKLLTLFATAAVPVVEQ